MDQRGGGGNSLGRWPEVWGAALLALPLIALALIYAWVYGLVGPPESPNVQKRVTAFGPIFALYFATVWWLWRTRGHQRGRLARLALVLIGAVVLRAIPLAGHVPRNPDLGRHLWEGLVLLRGHNP